MPTTIACTSVHPWLLSTARHPVKVLSGSMNVYVRHLHPDGSPGYLTFIAAASQGMVLFPVHVDDHADFTVIAVGNNDTRLQELPSEPSQWVAIARSESKGVANWLDAILIAAETDSMHTSKYVRIRADASHTVSSGTHVTALRQPAWVRAGDVTPSAAFTSSIDLEIVPVTGRFPAESRIDGTLQCFSTEAALESFDCISIIQSVHDLCIGLFKETRDNQSLQSVQSIERRVVLRNTTLQRSLTQFVGITDESSTAETIGAYTNPVVWVAARIASELATPFIVPSNWTSTDVDQVQDLLEYSRIRTRSVILSDSWYERAGYCMVCFCSDGRIAALIPDTSHRYVAHFADGTAEVVSRANADQYMSNALQVYRPFPERDLTGRDLLRFGLKPLKRDLGSVLFTGVAGGLLALFMPMITSVLFDTVIPMTERGQLLIITVGVALAAIVKGLFDLTLNISVLRIQMQSDVSLQAALWDRLLSLSPMFFRRYTAGELATRANGFAAMQQLIAGTTTNSLIAFIFGFFQLGFLFYRSSTLAWYALLILAVSMFVLALTSYLRFKRVMQVQDVYQKISGTILQLFTAISKIRVTASESFAFKLWADLFARQRRAEFSSNNLRNISTVLNAVVPSIASMTFYWVIKDLIADRKPVNVGDLLAFTGSFALFWGWMSSFTASFSNILMCIPLYRNVKPILDETPEVDFMQPDPGKVSGRIDFNNVSFRYDPDGPAIIEDVSMSINPGEFVALVGPSGSGKSTALRLLLGFEQPESGSIFIDGHDLRDVNIRQIRRQLGVVMQNGKVLSGDIGKNIIGASTSLTYDDAWEAARAAGLDQDIHDMPMGMHTVISERGGTLSGGQRQRLLIARALAGKPSIVLMDEATSALDNRTQEIVTTSLSNMNVTRVIVAHRLSTIIDADKIYVMDKGRIVEQGDYKSLMAHNGLFTELAKRQIS